MRKPAILIIGYHKIIFHHSLLVSSSLPCLTAREVRDSLRLGTEEKTLVHMGPAQAGSSEAPKPSSPSEP